ncbi:DNA primase [Desulfovibrio cuneatus]|uniref:DNA primase n=1 Tax=Desulfovibrio cuneatus TaxID=159728 RepID=UPI00041F60EB|nr:DNA primase [Desulfovibrio cuneatus]
MSRDSGAVTRAIKSRINIVDVVKRYVELRRMGNRWVAPCPFHQETKPSFSVNEEEGFFYCFGCQAAGDLFDFYSRVNGLDFKETLAQLAEEAGVQLNEVRTDPRQDKERSLRKLTLNMYAHASKHYQRNLVSPAGAICREYLERRKLDQAIIESFELGWSLQEWQGLANSLPQAGFTLRQGEESGLLARSDRGSSYDRFRGRLMFPIKNLSGQVIAFGGRIIGDEDAAKYINSTDSPVYKKGDNLYGLFQARRGISAKKSAILTEGYMDVLTLHQYGYTNACGALGTALTPEQVRRLAGFCSRLELLFDGDAPGRKAAMRACEMVLAKGLRCSVITLPEGEDIDSLLHAKGTPAFEELRTFAPDGLDFCIRTLSSTFAPKEALEWVKAFILSVEHAELLPRIISRLCQGLDFDEREMRRMVAEKLPASAAAQASGRGSAAGGGKGPAPAGKNGLNKGLMQLLVRYPHRAPQLQEAGLGLVLTESWAYALWEKILAAGPEYDPETIVRQLIPAEKEFWIQYRAMEAPPEGHEEEEVAAACRRIGEIRLEKQDSASSQIIRQHSSKNDYDMALLQAANETLLLKRARGSADE